MENNNILLTIGIPVFNAGNYIEDLLKLFKKSELINYEVIVIDDGSDDNSLSICNKYKSKWVHIFSQKNKGVSYTRNRIINLSMGKWITFVDSDDLIDFEKYIQIVNKIDETCDLGFSFFKKKYYEKIKYKKGYKLLSELLEKEYINSPVGKFYKKEILLKKKIFFNEKISLGEDLLFNLEYYKAINKIFLIDSVIYYIRRNNENSLTRKYNPKKYSELMYVNAECMKLFPDNKDIIKALEYIKIKNCMSCLRDYRTHKKSIGNLDEYVNKIKCTNIGKFIILNNLKTTVISLCWRIIPIKIILKLI